MNDRVKIPTAFWKGMTWDEFHEFSKTGVLNEEQCKRVWEIGELDGEPPESMEIILRESDVKKLLKTAFERRMRE